MSVVKSELLAVVLCCSLCSVLSEHGGFSIVDFGNGKILGRQLVSYNEKPYYAYQEIPYAKPPIDDLRFKEPVEAEHWDHLLNTTQNTKVCIQFKGNLDRENEDCLYLNIYTPKDPNKSSDLLPVLFWIHGGFFLRYDGTFETVNPEYLMDYDIVLVTINYRLGVLGLAHTEDDVVPGNLALKDQHLALKWVQKNILAFNGDPTKVTIAGQSAGGGAISYHVLSPKSKGLFRAAIIQSGSALCSKMLQRHPKYFAYQLGMSINSNFNSQNTSRELLQVLKEASLEDLKKYSELPIPEDKRNAAGSDGNTIWSPVIEKNVVSGYILNAMHESVKTGNVNKVPILIGIVSEERSPKANMEELKLKAPYYDEDASRLINGNLNILESNKRIAGKKIKAMYTNSTFTEDFGSFIRFLSDTQYTNGICRQADLQSKYADVYFYQFSLEGLTLPPKQTIPGLNRVGHAEELKYLFGFEVDGPINWTKTDRKNQQKCLKLWTNFIKYLNPTPAEDALFDNIIWKKVTPTNFVYMNINNTLEMRTNPRQYQEWRYQFEQYADDVQETF